MNRKTITIMAGEEIVERERETEESGSAIADGFFVGDRADDVAERGSAKANAAELEACVVQFSKLTLVLSSQGAALRVCDDILVGFARVQIVSLTHTTPSRPPDRPPIVPNRSPTFRRSLVNSRRSPVNGPWSPVNVIGGGNPIIMATTTIPYASIPEFLSHTNHKQWSLRVKTYLLSEDLWEVVEPATEIPKLEEADGEQEDDGAKNKVWATKNAKALHIIHNSCGSDMFSVISEISNAQTAWAALEQWCKEKQKAINNAKQLERYIPFLDYVIAGDWGNAKQCLRALPGAIITVDPRDENGDIALHVAARKGHLHIVKELVLLMRRVDLQAKNAKGSTAIHEAFQMNHVDIVKELLPWMGGVQNKDGDTVLHIAVRTHQPVTVMWMVKLMRREDLEVKNNFALTALNIAVRMRNARIINMLLPYVAGDEFDLYIPFMNAVIGGDWNNVKDCLGDLDSKSAGCAVRARDPRDGHDENTALHVAIKHGHVHIVKELVSLMISHRNLQEKNADTFKGKQLNADISEAEVVERAKYMVEQDAIQLAGVLEIQNAFGDTPLHQAVMSGNMGIVKELVFFMRHQGFAVKTNDGSTALHLAVMKADVDIVKMLVSQMRLEDLEIKGALGNTALHQAVKMGNMGIVKELVILMRQEGLEVKNDEGSNALHLAAMEKKLDIVRELISLMRPKALEETNGEGVTALCCVLNARVNDGDIWEVAKCMANKNKNVFGIRSPWNIIPVVWAADWGKWRLTHNFYSVTPPEALNGLQGAELMVFAIDRLKALGKSVLDIIHRLLAIEIL
ncbi:hypothetical protein ACLB2K_009734 [Fragaria x ananassa]